MRKILLAAFVGLLSVALVSGVAQAITGECSNCHTMHNSQAGSYVVQSYSNGSLTTGVATPAGFLLNATCIACHTGDTATATNSLGAPIVLHTSISDVTGQGAAVTLAGGDFYWVAKGIGTPDDTKGHNVEDIADPDANIQPNIGYEPPGWDAGATPGANGDGQVAGGTWGSQLTCAGKFGCHGNHTGTTAMDGILGAHHNNTGLTSNPCDPADTIGNSFRFLSGIKGLEDDDWQWTESESDHNEYFGANITGTRTSYSNKHTISYLCAECHGNFHMDIGSGSSPWLRHPTDIVLPSDVDKEYATYNDNLADNTYNVEAPVARSTVPDTAGSEVATGTGIVMCLSCHRAHGSPEPDLLRWTYSDMIAGEATDTTKGCFVCHTQKGTL